MMRFSTAVLLLATVSLSAGLPIPAPLSSPQQSEVEAPTIAGRSRRNSSGGTGRRLILSFQSSDAQSA